MRYDGIELIEGSKAENFTIDGGNSAAESALSPTVGELFFRTDLDQLRIYISTGWQTLEAGGSLELADLTNVSISSPASTEVLTFDGAEWVNSPASGGITEAEATAISISMAIVLG